MQALERIASAVEPPVLRAYAAVLVGRRSQRAPQMARTQFIQAAGETSQIAENTSDDRALLVDVLGLGGIAVRYSSSPIPSTNSFVAPQIAGVPFTFVLLPGETLFAQSLGASDLRVGQEYF